MTITEIFKKSKWALGKETPKEIYIGANFNSNISFNVKDKSKKALLTIIDSIPIYINPDLKGKKVRVKGKNKEVTIDLSGLIKHKLHKVQ